MVEVKKDIAVARVKVCLSQYDLLQNKAHVNDLQCSLKQAVSEHILAQRESKNIYGQLTDPPHPLYPFRLNPNPHPNRNPNPNPNPYPRLISIGTHLAKSEMQQARHDRYNERKRVRRTLILTLTQTQTLTLTLTLTQTLTLSLTLNLPLNFYSIP